MSPMSPDTIIAVQNVSKKFRLFDSSNERLLEALHPFRKQYHRDFWALHDVSFAVERGEVVGIMGRNGSGKSTLLQIICSVMQATQGTVSVTGRVSALLELGAGFNPEFTGRDNVILSGAIMGLSRKDMLARLPEIEAFADIGKFFDQPVKVYSSGMFARVAFSSAIHVNPDVLIVDEILSVGDAKFQEKCYHRIRTMRENGVCVLFVSHSVEAIHRHCDRAVLLDGGKMVAHDSADVVIAAYHDLLHGSGQVEKSETKKNVSSQKNAASSDDSEQSPLVDLQNFLDGSDGPICHKFSYYNAHERRLGNRDAEIVDFLVTADGRTDFAILSGQEEIVIYLKVRFMREVSRPELGWAIVSPEGIVITGSNTAMSKFVLPEVQSGETWIYSVSLQPAFCGGEYFFNIGVGETIDGTWTFLDNRRSAGHLSVEHQDHVTGFYHLPFKYQVISSPSHHE